MANVESVTQATFSEEVLKSEKKVVVDFWAPWCGPCRYVAPEVEKLARRHPDIKVVKLNVDEAPLIANSYGIMGIPTIGLFAGGNMVARVVGAMPVEQIEQQLGLPPGDETVDSTGDAEKEKGATQANG
ncbi:MAG: thioredoxin [Acidimicrobiia bacterium]